jgi:Xaa-Pro aminopeptidase
VDHALRRTRLAERLDELGVDALLVTRAPNVRYLTGFTGSNGQVVVGRAASIFLTDGRYDEQSRTEVADLERRVHRGPLLEPAVAAARDLGSARLGFEPEGITYGAWDRLRTYAGDLELIPAPALVEDLRIVKDADELGRIRRAQACADVAFENVVLSELTEGLTEREVAFGLDVAMRRAGADGPGFETIVAFGENAAEPHHGPTDRPLRRGDLVKVDMGGVFDGYHSDMTRTVAFGSPDERIRELYELVAAAQRAGVAAVAAGARIADVDRAARGVIEDAGHGERFPHGLGHGVGLEIHEAPMLRWDAQGELAAGAVVTVEPGVYIPGVGGVRIEDMVEVTPDGGRVIPSIAKELIVL